MADEATHPLATAAARAGGATDVVRSCDRLGRRVDAEIAALTGLAEASDANRQQIRATLKEFGRAAGSVSGGECKPYWTWWRRGISAIRVTADRLFKGEPWVEDIRGPNWKEI